MFSYYLLQLAQLVDGSNVKIPNKDIDPNDSQALSGTIQNIMQFVFGALGAIAVLIIVIAGLQYVISAGDPQKVNKAKNTIIYALVGLAIAILSYAIVAFVFERAFR